MREVDYPADYKFVESHYTNENVAVKTLENNQTVTCFTPDSDQNVKLKSKRKMICTATKIIAQW